MKNTKCMTITLIFLIANSLLAILSSKALAEVEVIELVNITHSLPPIQEVTPAWSPDGRKIVFSKGCDYTSGGAGTSLWVMDSNGTNQIKLNDPIAHTNINCPDWSPDGRKLVFMHDYVSGGDIWVMDYDGNNPKQLTFDNKAEQYPAWSPLGDKIAFSKGTYYWGTRHIWVMDADGSNQKQLTFGTDMSNSHPRWSPDGQKIVFNRAVGKGDYSQIFVMNSDGSDMKQLTFGNANHRNPAWSPDGQYIAYCSTEGISSDSYGELWVMNADGSDKCRITYFGGGVRWPRWHPTGNAIIFFHNSGGRCDCDLFVAFLKIDTSFSDSNYTISLKGVVADAFSGAPLPGVKVCLPNDLCDETDRNGCFLFNSVPPGEAIITARRIGYYTTSKRIVASQDSTTSVTLLMLPKLPNQRPSIIDVKGKYCGVGSHVYYIDGIDLYETFTVRVDWNGHQPGTVRWITPTESYEDPCPGNSVFRSFNMGTDFGESGFLKVVAVSADDESTSSIYTVNFHVIPPPPLISLVPSALFAPVPNGDILEYRLTSCTGLTLDFATWEPTRIDSSIPIFGGNEMKIGLELENSEEIFGSKLCGRIADYGKATFYSVGWDKKTRRYIRKGVRCKKGIKLPYVEAAPYTSLKFDFNWSNETRSWIADADIWLGCDLKYSSPQVPLGAILIVPIYMRTELSLDLDASLSLLNISTSGAEWNATFGFEPMAKGILGAGLSDVACVEGYLGGGFHAGVKIFPDVSWENPYLILVGGVQAALGPFRSALDLKYTWPEEETMAVVGLNQLVQNSRFTLLPREYLSKQIEEISVQQKDSSTSTFGVNELAILDGVFPYSTPSVVAIGEDVLAVWINDNVHRNLINRTQLEFSLYTCDTWSAPLAVFDDGTADINPQLVSLPGGGVICIWQDSNDSLNDTDSFETFKSHLEIAVSTYDESKRAWSEPVRLTNNSVFDRSPRIAAASTNNIIAVWIRNVSNDTWGSSSSPNDIVWSQYNGSNWSIPKSIFSSYSFGTILDTSLAYDGNNGVFVFSADGDDNLDTSYDQDLWVTSFIQGSWTAPKMLTSDSVHDSSPRLIYDQNGTLCLAWLKGDNILLAPDLDVSNAVVLATPGESLSAKDFALVFDNTGRAVVLWNDVSETYNDIWLSYYDSSFSVSSDPKRLTCDDASERFPSCVFDSKGRLNCLYDKTWTEYENRDETVSGQEVTVQNIPKAGRTDLYWLSYNARTDLSISTEDVSVHPPKAEPGSEVTVTAIVKNVGDIPCTDVDIGFYECDLEGNCKLITPFQTIAKVIAGGEGVPVSIPWAIPSPNDEHTLKVVVDPFLIQIDPDRSNNTVTISPMKADLTVEYLTVHNAGNNRYFTVRVSNEGSLSAEKIKVAIHKFSLEGDILCETEIPVIDPGSFKDATFSLGAPLSPSGRKVNIVAIVDELEEIDELDETNNTASIFVDPKRCPGDFDGDGDRDGSDLAILAGSGASGDIRDESSDSGVMDTDKVESFSRDFGHIDCL